MSSANLVHRYGLEFSLWRWMKAQISTHEIISRSKTELWHQILTHYLPLYFSEAERFHRSARSDWFLPFLEETPSPRHRVGLMFYAEASARMRVQMTIKRRVSRAPEAWGGGRSCKEKSCSN